MRSRRSTGAWRWPGRGATAFAGRGRWREACRWPPDSRSNRLVCASTWTGACWVSFLIAVGCAELYRRTLKEELRFGQLRLSHRERGMIELELDQGDTWRSDARRLAGLTRELDYGAWTALRVFVRTGVFPEQWLARKGFALRRSTRTVGIAGRFVYTVRWIGWAIARIAKGKRPRRYRQGPYVEGEQELWRCLDALGSS